MSWLQTPFTVILEPKKIKTVTVSIFPPSICQEVMKAETLLCQQRSIQSRLWFFQWSCMDMSWTIKKAECRRIDAFELWCGEDPWTARRSNQSILKEISPGCSLEGLMLKLKFQYIGHLMQTSDSLEKTLMLGGIGGRRRRGRQRMRWLANITDAMSLHKLQEMGREREVWSAAVHGIAKSST